MNLDDLPRVRLVHAPTPFHRFDRLARAFGIPRLFVKRDDCTGLAFGGNKTRKLEFTLGDAQAKGATVLITNGGTQSNHVRQTIAAAASAGMKSVVILYSPFDAPSALYVSSGNLLLDQVLGGEIHFVADAEGATAVKLNDVRASLIEQGERPYIVPLGASDGIGSLGYIVCANELVEDFSAHRIEPSHIFVGTGSAGTHAGLLAGLRLVGNQAAVIGISVSESAEIKRSKVRGVLDQIGQTLGIDLPVTDREIIVRDDYVGEGYGYPTPASRVALRSVARTEGVLLDPVYTAKAMAGMLDILGNNRLGPVRDPVFLHTGGAPALFAYGSDFDGDAQ